mgnify:FL=1
MQLLGVGNGMSREFARERPSSLECALVKCGERAPKQGQEDPEALLNDTGHPGRAIEVQPGKKAQTARAIDPIAEQPDSERRNQRLDNSLERRINRCTQFSQQAVPVIKHLRLGTLQQGTDQAVSRPEVIVQCGNTVARLGVDGAQRHRIDTALRKQPLRGVQNGFPPTKSAPFSDRLLTFTPHTGK